MPATHSLHPINQDRDCLVTRGISFQGARDYGKVINLALLHPPPPPRFSSLHWDDCQLCLCPCSTAFCSALPCCKWNTAEGGILIRWLATVSSRQSTHCVCVHMHTCVCVRQREKGRRDSMPMLIRSTLWIHLQLLHNNSFHICQRRNLFWITSFKEDQRHAILFYC